MEMFKLLPEDQKARDGMERQPSRARGRKRVQDIGVWLQCFAVFVGVVAKISPEAVLGLMAYMISIIRASQGYEGAAWAAYKRPSGGKQLRLTRFLGIELNTKEMSLRLPAEKLLELRMLVASWLGMRFCTVKELESLVGKLQHASKVIRPGRTFMRRMFELLKGARRGQQFARLNAPIKSDLQWWHLFMAQWNGVAMMANSGQVASGRHLYSDASGTFGCGAW